VRNFIVLHLVGRLELIAVFVRSHNEKVSQRNQETTTTTEHFDKTGKRKRT